MWATSLKSIIDQYGGHSVVLGERTQLATHVSKTFLKAIGSPTILPTMPCAKDRSTRPAAPCSAIPTARSAVDYRNTRHIVLYGRNIFEAVSVKEVNNLMKAMEDGAKMTYIDPRVSITATKAHRYWMIRPGTDLALNYALMHVILDERLYDAAFVDRWVHGLAELQDFVEPYTPQWAETETGIPAEEIIALARELAKDSGRRWLSITAIGAPATPMKFTCAGRSSCSMP
jgi:thiosulfate reductase/polysulfide reductase chain A